MSYLKELAKVSGNEFANLVDDGIFGGDVEQFIDTGSYVFNALLSGSIYGGLPANKITAIAGESATGKTFFTLGLVKRFLDMNEKAGVIYFESESALTSDMLREREIDVNRVIHIPVSTVEEFRMQAVKILEKHTEVHEADRPPLMMCLDSLGMLSTEKELGDMTDGKVVRDMTKAQVLKGAFRVLTLMLAKANVPFIVTNHVYDQIGSMYPQKVMGGGSAVQYAASSIVFLSKRKEKEGTEVIGNIIHCKMQKSRMTKENKMVDVRLSYDTGLDRYYGLLELAEKYNVIKKVSTRYELPDGTKMFGKQIMGEPEKYFTDELMERLEEAAQNEFKYGKVGIDEVDDSEESELQDSE